MKTVIFTVTNNLNYDQRMIRVCTSLANAGYDVLLVGATVERKDILVAQPYRQRRLHCVFPRGKLFYMEYNIRLFFYLLFERADALCAIDLDTILPCYCISRLKKIARVYDAHELFCEMKEIVTRPGIYRSWKRIEKFSVPKFRFAYTVNSVIAEEFRKMYGTNMTVIRNVPLLQPLIETEQDDRVIIYQGAVNEGRSFETLIPAMQRVNAKLHIYGVGNFLMQAKTLVQELQLEQKVIFKGRVLPTQLRKETARARVGVTLFENNGLSNYLSLANRFFDYMHAGIPQLCVDYPAYREINNQYQFAVLTMDLSPAALTNELNRLLEDEALYQQLRQGCLVARNSLNWQVEEKELLSFYRDLFAQVG